MFNVLKGLTKAVVGVATLPIDIAADVVTHSGVLWETRKKAIEDAVKFREKCREIEG